VNTLDRGAGNNSMILMIEVACPRWRRWCRDWTRLVVNDALTAMGQQVAAGIAATVAAHS
jgi:hypothetical protein